MALTREPDARFAVNLRIVTRAGIEPPPAIAELRERLDDFQRQAFISRVRDRVVDGIINNNPADDVPLLFAAACAETHIPDEVKNELMLAVREKVNAACRAAYADVAVQNYQEIARRFDDAAQAFVTAAEVCDPRCAAEDVVGASEKVRRAYVQTGACAAELTQLMPVLRAAAELAGIISADPDDIITLTVDPGDLSRETLVNAWDIAEREARIESQRASGYTTPEPTHTRGGRWTALWALYPAGCRIRALPINEQSLAKT